MGIGGIGRGMTAVARKALIPRSMPPEVELSQTILGKLNEDKLARKWYQFKAKSGDPFSLSVDQLNSESRGLFKSFVRTLGSWARSGTGAGIISGNDTRNEKKVAEVIQNYFSSRVKEQTGPEFGVFMKRTLGLVNKPGDAFVPVETYKTFLYDQFDKQLANYADSTIDLSNLRKFFLDSTDPRMIGIYNELKSSKLLPPLTGIESRQARRTLITTKTSTMTSGASTDDVTKLNLLKENAEPRRSYTATEAKRTKLGERTTETERVIDVLNDPRPSKEDVDLAWQNIPAQAAEKIPRLISDSRVAMDEAWNKQLGHVHKLAREPFNKFLADKPELLELEATARSYFGQKQKALYTATITGLRNALAEKASGVAATFDPLKGNAGEKYDQLLQVKNALYFSAATPKDVGESAIKQSLTGLSRPEAVKMYEDSIIRPLRFRFVDSATDSFGRIDPGKLIKNIEQIEAEAPEMLTELWGSKTQVKYIKEFALTHQAMLNNKMNPKSSIFIQLKTAAAVGGVAGGMWGFVNGDNPAVSSAAGAGLGAATILLSPIVLAKALANPSMTRALTDGLQTSASRGGISASLAMTLRKMGEMKVASSLFRENPSQDTMQFYNFAPITSDE
jgi:hypothetical protein